MLYWVHTLFFQFKNAFKNKKHSQIEKQSSRLSCQQVDSTQTTLGEPQKGGLPPAIPSFEQREVSPSLPPALELTLYIRLALNSEITPLCLLSAATITTWLPITFSSGRCSVTAHNFQPLPHQNLPYHLVSFLCLCIFCHNQFSGDGLFYTQLFSWLYLKWKKKKIKSNISISYLWPHTDGNIDKQMLRAWQTAFL